MPLSLIHVLCYIKGMHVLFSIVYHILDVPIPINIGITFSTTTPRGRHVSKKLDVKAFPFDSRYQGGIEVAMGERAI